MSEIKVSIIIASYNSRGSIGRCLRSLEKQRNPDEFEVIVVDSSNDGTADVVAKQFPKVKLCTSLERRLPGDARNVGVSQARGEILAFADADSFVDERWVSAIIRAHQGAYPVVGGALENGDPSSYRRWAYYFCELSKWMPGLPAGEVEDVPTCGLSMKRWAFERYGPFLERTYGSDTAFSWKMKKDGYPPLFLPSLRIWHVHSIGVADFLKRRIIRGSHFARLRMRELGRSTQWRIAFLLGAPLLPFVLLYRTARRVSKSGMYRGQFLASVPLVFCGLAAWSLGEVLGSLWTGDEPSGDCGPGGPGLRRAGGATGDAEKFAPRVAL